MTQEKEKKTITLPNGVAEEGDRVIWADIDESGNASTEIGVMKISERTGNWCWKKGVTEIGVDGIGEDNFFIAFSPTDALEAVEDAAKQTHIDEKPHAVLEKVRYMIQQKRKGHE